MRSGVRSVCGMLSRLALSGADRQPASCSLSTTNLASRIGDPRYGGLTGASGVFPAYKKARSIRFLTFDTCHRPPRAVRTPRALRAAAIPRRSVTPVARIASTMGSVFAANNAAFSARALRPCAVASDAFRRLPSLAPCAFRAASADRVRGNNSDGHHLEFRWPAWQRRIPTHQRHAKSEKAARRASPVYWPDDCPHG
jgi:hypothetical protein